MEEQKYRKQRSIDFSIAQYKILLQNGKSYQPSWRQNLRNLVWKVLRNSPSLSTRRNDNPCTRKILNLNMSLRSFLAMEMLKIICTIYATGWKEMTISMWSWLEISDKIVCQGYMSLLVVWKLLLCTFCVKAFLVPWWELLMI